MHKSTIINANNQNKLPQKHNIFLSVFYTPLKAYYRGVT